jgi:hypothetical protein
VGAESKKKKGEIPFVRPPPSKISGDKTKALIKTDVEHPSAELMRGPETGFRLLL